MSTNFDRKGVITVSQRAAKAATIILTMVLVKSSFPGVIIGDAGGLVSE